MRLPSVGERPPRRWARGISFRPRVARLVLGAFVFPRRPRGKCAVGPPTVHVDSVTHTSGGLDNRPPARPSQVLALPTLRPSRKSQVDPTRTVGMIESSRSTNQIHRHQATRCTI